MAGASLLKLLDDVTAVLDDVAILTKIATKQTAGVVGDDLALNVEQCSGGNISAERELPIVFGVMWGSFINKLILIPTALLISYYAPVLIGVMLMIGGFYLSFEGGEKVLEKVLHRNDNDGKGDDVEDTVLVDVKEWEKKRIKGAIKTDFVLSAEIIIIALGAVSNSPFLEQVIVVSLVGFLMTVGVYCTVAAIVKLDDVGLYLLKHSRGSNILKAIGSFLVSVSPRLMKLLTIIGTIAMFVVGGELIRHNIPYLEFMNQLTVGAGGFKTAVDTTVSGLFGVVVGCTMFLTTSILKKIKK